MRPSTLLVAGLVSAGVVASSAPPEIGREEVPEPPNVVWLCGDSTMAPGGGHNGTEGWGEYLRYSLFLDQDQDAWAASSATTRGLVRVNNSAYAGRSARTFTRERRFQAVAEQVRPGDWAVFQFGHNDGPGDPANDTKHRIDCPGMGNETCSVTYDNQTEIVQTYVTYLVNAAQLLRARGARVIIASPTPTNPYSPSSSGDGDDYDYAWAPTVYAWYAWHVVDLLGGPRRGVYYVDHGAYAARALQRLGGATVATKAGGGFPMDDTHTAPWLADVFARAFVLGVKCGTAGGLAGWVGNATSRILEGACARVNGSLPI